MCQFESENIQTYFVHHKSCVFFYVFGAVFSQTLYNVCTHCRLNSTCIGNVHGCLRGEAFEK